jgi:hypothetical protein
MPQHRKVAPLGDAAFRLHVTAMAWCIEEKIDGKIPKEIPQTMTRAPQGKALDKVVAELIKAGLWVATDAGYEIKNFLDWNLSAAEIAARSEAKAKAGASGGRSSGQARRKQEPSKPEAAASPPLQPAAEKVEAKAKPLSLSLSLSLPGEEEIPPPPSDGEAEPDSAVVAELRKHGESFERSFGKRPAFQRADVLELHAEWRKQFGRGDVALVVGSNHDDANALADAIDAHTLANCLFVARHAKFDGMVSGRVDEQKNPHESIRYIFGTPETFSRILRDGTKRERDASGQSALARMRDLKSRDAGEA